MSYLIKRSGSNMWLGKVDTLSKARDAAACVVKQGAEEVDIFRYNKKTNGKVYEGSVTELEDGTIVYYNDRVCYELTPEGCDP